MDLTTSFSNAGLNDACQTIDPESLEVTPYPSIGVPNRVLTIQRDNNQKLETFNKLAALNRSFLKTGPFRFTPIIAVQNDYNCRLISENLRECFHTVICYEFFLLLRVDE